MKKQVSPGKRSGSSVTAPLGCFLQVRPRCPMCHILACGGNVSAHLLKLRLRGLMGQSLRTRQRSTKFGNSTWETQELLLRLLNRCSKRRTEGTGRLFLHPLDEPVSPHRQLGIRAVVLPSASEPGMSQPQAGD